MLGHRRCSGRSVVEPFGFSPQVAQDSFSYEPKRPRVLVSLGQWAAGLGRLTLRSTLDARGGLDRVGVFDPSVIVDLPIDGAGRLFHAAFGDQVRTHAGLG